MFHIQKNIVTTFKTNLDGLLFKAAKATTSNGFDRTINEIKMLNWRAGEYIEKIDKTKWARAHFPVRRYGQVTSNISESMNRMLEEVRHKYPVNLFMTFVRKINVTFDERRRLYAEMRPSDLPGKVAKMLAKSREQGETLDVRPHTRTLFDVQMFNNRGSWRVVDLETMSCSCGFFDEHGVPCRHMCAAVLSIGGNPHDLVVPERRVERLKALWVGVITPVDPNLLTDDELRPPVVTKRRGRPNESRYKSTAEKRPKKIVRCGNCDARDHNTRTCPAPPN